MGRSPSFCFNIKACAGDVDDGDSSKQPEIKSSPEKRRWSFRKKFVGHHAPSNTVISESLPIFSENQNQEASSDALSSEKTRSDFDHTSIVEQTSPVRQLPADIVSAREPMEFSISAALVDYNIEENDAIVIQSSIRRSLAQNELQKLKNVVKLQAAARGYLVRRQAAGTLRCIQAIVKMQALVRARHSVQSAKLTEINKLDECISANVEPQSNVDLNRTPSAVRKLVSSAFARQLVQSTQKTKAFYISCDPLRTDSAWNWLERWMALTSMDQQKILQNQDDLAKDLKNGSSAYDVDTGLHIVPQDASSNSELTVNSSKTRDVEGDLIAKSYRTSDVSASAHISDQFLTPVQDNELKSRVQDTAAIEEDNEWSKKGLREVSDYISSQMQQPLNASSGFELDGNPSKLVYTEDDFERSIRKEFNDALENEGGKVVNGSRKSKNPAFAAAQAKFEELSSAPGTDIYFSHASSDVSVLNLEHSQVDFTSKENSEKKSTYSNVDSKLKEVILNENLPSQNPEGQVTVSGYGTDISVSSHNRSEDSLAKVVPEFHSSDEINHVEVNGTNGSLKFDVIQPGMKNNVLELLVVRPQMKAALSVLTVEAVQVEQKLTEITISSIQEEEQTEDGYVEKPSPDGSPMSHTVASDSPATPSNHVSQNVPIIDEENHNPRMNKRSHLTAKNSSTHIKNDSAVRSSRANLQKETENVKRPSSSGTDKSNHTYHEDINSTSSLPGYMQLTESAKAKINTSSSHKSSISFHHKDNNTKKRHSLPFGDEKQGLSPRTRSLAALTSQDLKGNGVSSPNSTERRWYI